MNSEPATTENETPPARPPLPKAPAPGLFPLLSDYGRDVSESWIASIDPVLLSVLLLDRSTGRRIRWCTTDYSERGAGFGFGDEISPAAICGGEPVIRPRVDKRLEEQKSRAASKGEVFTPAWVCNAQNNLLDQSWFGKNIPIFNKESGTKWNPTDDKTLIAIFRNLGLSRADYWRLVRLEVSCGEAPYLTSRYDAATGEPIPVARRIGLLDRKLRTLSLQASTPAKWCGYAAEALQSIYAFEWQGDNVLLARENLLFATLEAFAARWPDVQGLSFSVVESFASVLSWNVFQMDGIKMVAPGTDVCPIVVDWKKSDFEPRTVPFRSLFPSELV